jgi:L-asparaginase II
VTAHPRGFASDNNSGAHPDVLAAIAEANDGHVPAYGDDDRTAAGAFSRVAELPGGERIAEAMRAHPELVGGAGQADTELMRALPGWIAKGGAEGLMCAAGPDGLGVALKADDGSNRPMRPALHAFFGHLGLELSDQFARVPVRNAHGEDVGEVVCALSENL